MLRRTLVPSLLLLGSLFVSPLLAEKGGSESPAPFAFSRGDRIVVLGNTFGERMGEFGFFETFLHAAFPEHQLTLRNLCWSGDEVSRVAERPTKAMDKSGEPYPTGRTVLLQPRPMNFGSLSEHLAEQKPSVLILCFGMNESFRGEEGIESFTKDLNHLITEIASQNWSGQGPPRMILVSPIAHENLGGHSPNPAKHNLDLEQYVTAMRKAARDQNVPFIDLFKPTKQQMADANSNRMTINGIHLNRYGALAVSVMMAEQLGIPLAKARQFEAIAKLNKLVVEKNQQFLYRWRAVNGEYIYGRRKEPFGVVNFPAEMKQLDELVAEFDKQMHELVLAE